MLNGQAPAISRALNGVRRPELTAFLVVVLFQAVAIALHQQWLDEYQSWLIARSSTLLTLSHNMRFEGHPYLWSLLLMPFAALTSDPAVIKILQFFAAVIATWAIMFRAPFGIALKLALALNYFILFEYSEIGRSYTLGMVLWVVALVMWPHWIATVCLALMMHVSMQFLWLAGLLVLYRWATMAVSWTSLVGLGISAVAALVSMWPDPATVPAANILVPDEAISTARSLGLFEARDPVEAALALGGIVMPMTSFRGWFFWGDPGWFGIGGLLGLAGMAVAALYLFEKSLLRMALLVLMLALVAVFTAFVYPSSPRHLGVVPMLIVALIWLGGFAGRKSRAAFACLAVIWAVQGVAASAVALFVRPISSDAAAAEWAVSQGLGQQAWAVSGGFAALGISALARTPVYNIEQGCFATFHRWNQPRLRLPPDEVMARLAAAAQGRSSVYAISRYAKGAATGAINRDDATTPKAQFMGIAEPLVTKVATFGPDYHLVYSDIHRIEIPTSVVPAPSAPCR